MKKKIIEAMGIPGAMLGGTTTYASSSTREGDYRFSVAELVALTDRIHETIEIDCELALMTEPRLKANERYKIAESLWYAREAFERSLRVLAVIHKCRIREVI
jgi:hypothetical protein